MEPREKLNCQAAGFQGNKSNGIFIEPMRTLNCHQAAGFQGHKSNDSLVGQARRLNRQAAGLHGEQRQ